MDANVIERKWIQGMTVKPDSLLGQAFTGEEGAHVFRITGETTGGAAVPITGTIAAKFLRSDNITVPLSGSVSDGVAVVTLTDECYLVPGRFIFSIYVIQGDLRMCIYCGVGNVFRTDSDEYEGGQIITDITELKAEIQAAVESIPPDYSELTGEVADLKSDFTSWLIGKKISIIGDSIDTFNANGYKIDGYAMYYPAQGVTDVKQTWWYQVIVASGASLEVNASYSGSRVTNTYSGRPDFYDRVTLIGNPDLVFVTLGTNDSTNKVALGDYDYETTYTSLSESQFRPAYIKGIKALQATYPNAKIVCISEQMGDSYKESVRAIAQTLGALFIDAGDYVGSSGVHPGPYGMNQIARLVLFPTDATLSAKHIAADAKATGDAVTELKSAFSEANHSISVLNDLVNPPVFGSGSCVTAAAWREIVVLKNINMTAGKTYRFTFTLAEAQSGNVYIYGYNSDGAKFINAYTFASGTTSYSFNINKAYDVIDGYITIGAGGVGVSVNAEWSGTGFATIDTMQNDTVTISEELVTKFYDSIEAGSIDSVGSPTSATNRARTSGFIDVDELICVDPTKYPNYKIFVFLYSTNDTSGFIARIPSDWDNTYVSKRAILSLYPTTKYVKVAIRRGDSATMTTDDLAVCKAMIGIGMSIGDVDAVSEKCDQIAETVKLRYDDFEIGGIGGTSGDNIDSTTTVRTKGYINVEDFWCCNLAGNLVYKTAAYLYDANKIYIGRPATYSQAVNVDRSVINSDTYPTARYIRFTFIRADGGTITTTDIDTLKNIIYTSQYTPTDIMRQVYAVTDELTEDTNDIDRKMLSVGYINLEVGTINGSDGMPGSSNSRVRTADYIDIDDFVCCDLTGQSNYQMYVYLYYSDQSLLTRLPLDFSAVEYTRSFIKANYPSAKYVKLLFRKPNNTTMTNADVLKIRPFVLVKRDFNRTDVDKARFDNQFNFIAYSHLSTGATDGPINSAEHFYYCAKAGGFTSLKGDVRPTSDGKLIMCHDDGYTFDGNGKIIAYNSSNNTKINTLTEAQCKALVFAEQYDGKDCHPTDFETYVRICKKYGLIAFVTVRDEQIASVIAPEVLRILRLYRMTDRAIINSFTRESLEVFRAMDSGIMLSNVMTHNQAPTTENVDFAYSLGNCLINLFDVPVQSDGSGRNWELILDDVLTSYASVLEYARSKNVLVYEAQTGNAGTDVIMKHGIMGTQMYMIPEYDYTRN